MMEKYPFPKAVIFDWDNTLVDSVPVVYEAMKKTYETFGLVPPTLDDTYHMQGFSLRDSFPKVFGDDWEKAKTIYLSAFEAVHLEKVKPFDKTEELLAYAFEKIGVLAVLSNKTGRILRQEADWFGWTRYFKALVGSTDAPVDKPAKEAVDFALKDTGIDRAKDPVWFVGDGAVDVMCARAAGAYPVHVGSKKGFEDVPCVLERTVDMIGLLRSYDL